MQHCIIDRIENGIAVCELDDKTLIGIPVIDLPEGVREGDCLVKDGGSWEIDFERAASRKERISKLASSLFVD